MICETAQLLNTDVFAQHILYSVQEHTVQAENGTQKEIYIQNIPYVLDMCHRITTGRAVRWWRHLNSGFVNLFFYLVVEKIQEQEEQGEMMHKSLQIEHSSKIAAIMESIKMKDNEILELEH